MTVEISRSDFITIFFWQIERNERYQSLTRTGYFEARGTRDSAHNLSYGLVSMVDRTDMAKLLLTAGKNRKFCRIKYPLKESGT